MDLNTLRTALREGVGYLPKEYREKAAAILNDVSVGLDQAMTVVDDTVADLADYTAKTSIYDDVRKDVGNPPNSFDDIVDAGWDIQPDATSGGREDYSLSDVVDVIYTYVCTNNDSYMPWNLRHATWNRENPVAVTVDFLQMIVEDQIGIDNG